MISHFFKYIFGTKDEHDAMRLSQAAHAVTSRESWAASLADSDFPEATAALKKRLAAGEKRVTVRADAYALAREAAKRVLGERPYDVQIMGAVALDEGAIAEMKTGEGKTLVCVMPAYFNSLDGKGVHVITVNEYLAKRDATWMGAVYQFLGISCGVIYAGMELPLRKDAYACDITYGTNSEFAFDYLRDNMQYTADGRVQRGFHYAVIDEADSILIDEARTPLIISGEGEDDSALCRLADSIANSLREVKKLPGTNRYPDELLGEIPDGDYTVDLNHKKVSLTKSGMDHVERMLTDRNAITGSMYDTANFSLVHYVIEAVTAHAAYEKDRDYIVSDGEVLIVDEFTGRILSGRRYGEGLHEAIEAKEGLEVKKQTRTFAEISYQSFFRMYEKLSGMTGTARSQAEELATIYWLNVLTIPPNRPVQRQDDPDSVFETTDEKWHAVCDEIEQAHRTGQPVLVGTSSVRNSEHLSSLLTRRGIHHDVLNAKNNEREAAIIAQAGKKGAVTIATNMAGRGTDIKLGGSDVVAAGGLYVIGTERYESKRIDNQLRGRSGRQGDPGRSKFFISKEDDLFLRIPSMRHSSAATVQQETERIYFEMRKRLLDFDNVLNDQRMTLYEYRRSIADGEGAPEKKIPMLATIDSAWADHLEALDALREGVYLRTYAQRNPVVEYKIDASRMFSEMMDTLAEAEEHLR